MMWNISREILNFYENKIEQRWWMFTTVFDDKNTFINEANHFSGVNFWKENGKGKN